MTLATPTYDASEYATLIKRANKASKAAAKTPKKTKKSAKRTRARNGKQTGVRKQQDAAIKFFHYWKTFSTIDLHPVAEHRFHSVRRFRFDAAFVDQKIAVEIEGGTRSDGRHVRPEGYKDDCIKYNLANDDVWHVYRFTTEMMSSDPYGMVLQVQRALERRMAFNRCDRVGLRKKLRKRRAARR